MLSLGGDMLPEGHGTEDLCKQSQNGLLIRVLNHSRTQSQSKYPDQYQKEYFQYRYLEPLRWGPELDDLVCHDRSDNNRG